LKFRGGFIVDNVCGLRVVVDAVDEGEKIDVIDFSLDFDFGFDIVELEIRVAFDVKVDSVGNEFANDIEYKRIEASSLDAFVTFFALGIKGLRDESLDVVGGYFLWGWLCVVV